MLTRILVGYKFSESGSILKAALKYKDSKIQKKMHEFVQDSTKVEAQKKLLKLDELNKVSGKNIMIREYQFQEKQETYEINFIDKCLIPCGKWTRKQLLKYAGMKQDADVIQSEEENQQLIQMFQGKLLEKFKKYYENLGKFDYTISIKQQIHKVSKMSAQQFQTFMTKLNMQK